MLKKTIFSTLCVLAIMGSKDLYGQGKAFVGLQVGYNHSASQGRDEFEVIAGGGNLLLTAEETLKIHTGQAGILGGIHFSSPTSSLIYGFELALSGYFGPPSKVVAFEGLAGHREGMLLTSRRLFTVEPSVLMGVRTCWGSVMGRVGIPISQFIHKQEAAGVSKGYRAFHPGFSVGFVVHRSLSPNLSLRWGADYTMFTQKDKVFDETRGGNTHLFKTQRAPRFVSLNVGVVYHL